jgi:DNA transformation protein
MKTSPAFADHCLDLFSGLGPVVARAMFGGYGFYVGHAMFAIGDAREWKVWLKVDEQTRARFEQAGGEPFTYSSKGSRTTTLSFLTPPVASMEDGEAMLAWARLALQAAERALARRTARQAASPRAKPKRKAAAKKRATPGHRAARRRQG